MRTYLLLTFIFLCSSAFSESILEIYVEKDTIIENQGGSVVIVGTIEGYSGECSEPYVFIDDTVRIAVEQGKFRIESESGGIHKITVGGSNCDGVEFENVEFRANRYMEVTFTLYRNDIPVLVEKPVVYLYNDEDFDFEVRLNPKGALLFTYPSYEEGWSGRLQNQTLYINDKEYDYLFWESEQIDLTGSVDWSTSDVVNSEHVVSYLENQLRGFGLNSRERNDFITYWAPRMLRHSSMEVVFLINDQCSEAIGELQVSPTPENMVRVFMVFRPSKPAALSNKVSIPSKKLHREGFTVVEWGGAEITLHP